MYPMRRDMQDSYLRAAVDGEPEPLARPGDWGPTPMHADRGAHLSTVIERRLAYARQIRAVDTKAAELEVELRVAARIASQLSAFDPFPSALAHEIGCARQKIGPLLRDQERIVSALSREREAAAKRSGVAE